MSNKLSNAIVDERLIERPIIRLGNYKNYATPITWQCKNCQYIWDAAPSNIFSKSKCGCPYCAGNMQHTNKSIDDILVGRNIQRKEDYPGNNYTPMLFKCTLIECQYEWKTAVVNISKGTGCLKCNNSLPITNEEFDKRLKAKEYPVKRLEPINGMSKLTLFQCTKCLYEWITRPADIMQGKLCRPCGYKRVGQKLSYSNEEFDNIIKDRPIKRITDYNGKDNPMSFQCLNCLHEWTTTPGSIKNGNCGCPACNKYGYNAKMMIDLLTKDSQISFHQEYNIKNINSTTLNNYRLDIYFPQLKLAIEYNGIQHYQPTIFYGMNELQAIKRFEQQQLRDKYIDQFCKDNGITIIWIDWREYQGAKLKQYIMDKIVPILV